MNLRRTARYAVLFFRSATKKTEFHTDIYKKKKSHFIGLTLYIKYVRMHLIMPYYSVYGIYSKGWKAMKRKNDINIPLIAAAVVFVGLIAVVAVLGIKAGNSGRVRGKTEDTTTAATESTTEKESSSLSVDESSLTDESITEETGSSAVYTGTYSTKKSSGTSAAPKTSIVEKTVTKLQTTAAAVVSTTIMNGAEVPVYEQEDLKKGSANKDTTAGTNTKLTADMTFAGLYTKGYDVYGPKSFIYNDDTSPNCTQRKFGYNKFYDFGANLIDFSIDTVRIKFTYAGKPYMIQMWKGQYISGDIGTVGGEVGIYTRDPKKAYTASHYDCAAESDWLNCEMTIFWDDDGDGVYTPQFTRKYATHWWETGYVDGQLKNKRDSSPLRLMQRITFKDEAQAAAFESGLVSKGFKSVSEFSPDVPDTVKRQGRDVIYIWQYIKE